MSEPFLYRTESEKHSLKRCWPCGARPQKFGKRFFRKREDPVQKHHRFAPSSSVDIAAFRKNRCSKVNVVEEGLWCTEMTAALRSMSLTDIRYHLQIGIRRGVPDGLKSTLYMAAHDTRHWMKDHPGFYTKMLNNTFGSIIPEVIDSNIPTFSTGIVGINQELHSGKIELDMQEDMESWQFQMQRGPSFLQAPRDRASTIENYSPSSMANVVPGDDLSGQYLEFQAYQAAAGGYRTRSSDVISRNPLQSAMEENSMMGSVRHGIEDVTGLVELMNPKGREAAKRILWCIESLDQVEFCPLLPPLTCVLLCYLSEEETFNLVHNIINHSKQIALRESIGVRPYLSITVNDFIRYIQLVVGLLERHMSRLIEHLVGEGVDIIEIVCRWMADGLASALPLDYFLRIIGSFLFEGSKVFIRYVFALFKLNEDKLLNCNKQGAYDLLKCRQLRRKPISCDELDNLTKLAFQFAIRTTSISSYSSSHELLSAYVMPGTKLKLYRPRLHEESAILDEVMWTDIWAALVEADRMLDPHLAFSTQTHGCSGSAMDRRLKMQSSSPCLMVFRTRDDEILGCYLPFVPGHGRHHTALSSNSNAFVFCLKPHPLVYYWMGHNPTLLTYDATCLAVGADAPAIFIETSDLKRGNSQPCRSFQSTSVGVALVQDESGDFEISMLECWCLIQCGSSSIGTTKGAYVKGFCRRCYHKNYDRQRTLQNRLRTVTSGSRLQQADSDNPVLVASDSDEESHTLECLRSVDALNENDLEDVLNDIVPTSSCEDVVHLETLFPTPFGCSCPNKRRRHETCAHLEHISVEDDPGRLEVPPLPPPGWTPPGSLTPRSPTQTTPEFYSEEEFGSSEEWTPADCLASIRLKPPFSLCEKGNPWVLSPDDLREISRSVHRSTRQLGSALQGLPVPSCFRFVSWNINGPNRSKTSDLRRTLIRHLLESSGADLAMFQENMWVTKNFVRQLGGDLPLKYSGVPLHAGIARRRRILLRRLTTGGLLEHAHQLVFGVPLGQCHTTVVPLRVRGLTRTGWEEVWNTVLRSKDTPEDRFKTLFRVINRSHCCLYQHTPRKSLLIVSYHNVNKWTVRRDAFVACFWFAHLQTRGLLTDGDTSLIVCGDFNQDIAGMLDEQPLADLHYCLPAYDVTPRRRRKSAIDFVLTRGDVRVRDLSSWDFGVAHAWDPLSTGCRPASPIFGIHESHHLVECPEKAAACGQVFDHDPLVGLLEFL